MTWCEVCGDHHPVKVVPRGTFKPGAAIAVECVGQEIREEGETSFAHAVMERLEHGNRCTCGPCPVHQIIASTEWHPESLMEILDDPEPDTTCTWCQARYAWPGERSYHGLECEPYGDRIGGSEKSRYSCPACEADSGLFGEQDS